MRHSSAYVSQFIKTLCWDFDSIASRILPGQGFEKYNIVYEVQVYAYCYVMPCWSFGLGILVFWPLAFWYFDILAFWSFGLLAFWSFAIWSFGLLVFWYFCLVAFGPLIVCLFVS